MSHQTLNLLLLEHKLTRYASCKCVFAVSNPNPTSVVWCMPKDPLTVFILFTIHSETDILSYLKLYVYQIYRHEFSQFNDLPKLVTGHSCTL